MTDAVEGLGIDAGKLVLSPTRTYAPVVKTLLEELKSEIHGMVHCSGGAQTKILHFINNLKVVKNNLFPVPPLFKLIQKESGTDWKEMYKVFNMGIGFVVITNENEAEKIMETLKDYCNCQIIGKVTDDEKITVKTFEGSEVTY